MHNYIHEITTVVNGQVTNRELHATRHEALDSLTEFLGDDYATIKNEIAGKSHHSWNCEYVEIFTPRYYDIVYRRWLIRDFVRKHLDLYKEFVAKQ